MNPSILAMNCLKNILIFQYLLFWQKTKTKKKSNKLVNIIKRGKIDLKIKIEEMSKEEIKIEKPNKIVKIVEDILEFNKKKQSGGGLNI